MNIGKGSTKGKSSPLVIVLYIIAAIMAALFIYMIWANVKYIIEYMDSYGMSVSDMGAEAVKYIITESISYIVYAVVIFGIARILRAVQIGRCEDAGKQVSIETEAAKVSAEETEKAPETLPEDAEEVAANTETETEATEIEAVKDSEKEKSENDKEIKTDEAEEDVEKTEATVEGEESEATEDKKSDNAKASGKK